ncbi:ATP-binding protein [Litchfieldia salsa]|uniref:histidine kinase n=1 Tax=Litchfieldia salsa TaxID=930152 RepID=A0A1H0RLP9_9BACI|nr:ATP-binding protein [Litchfieldia salsa]SDP30444.1 two-component system, sporulation sensor kinase B [Litchfieldia salsa]
MIDLIKPIIVNITILFSLTFNANLFFPFNSKKPSTKKQNLIYGVISAFAATLCMLFPIEGIGETHFDLRMIIIFIVTLYGGVKAGGICTITVIVVRFFIGGTMAPVGIFVSFLAYVIAVLLRQWYIPARKFAKAVTIILIYFSFYFVTLLYFVPNLETHFYFIYFGGSILTSISLVFIIEKLIKVNEQFNETVYSDKLSTVSQMAASIAHEIRNPITTVRGFIQFLEKDTMDDKLKQYAPLILQELDRTNMIITNYLRLSKPNDFKMKEINLNKILVDSIDLLKPYGTYQNVSLFYNGSGTHYVLGDEDHLKQSIINVIKNGIEAVSDGSGYVKVSKRSTEDKRKVIIEIEDNGKGMTRDELSKLGLPYFTTKSKGTGLGSMITNRLIFEMDGSIEYVSTPNKGTIVRITLASSVLGIH